MMCLKIYKIAVTVFFYVIFFIPPVTAQTDSMFLSVDQLFELGVRYNLSLRSDELEASMAEERKQDARAARLPDLQVGFKGGVIGQPVVFTQGLSDPIRPETPDWSQNYAIDLEQPLYQGGKVHYSIKKADLEKEIADLRKETDCAEIKLDLLRQYMNLFSLFKQHEILTRNIEESERRLHDIRRMKQEGLITNNDVLRSEMQLTNDRLSLQEAENSIVLVSQQLDILLNQQEDILLIPDTTLLRQAVFLDHYENYVNQAYENDPSMKLLRKQTELAENGIPLSRSSLLPNISLYASNTLARPISRTMVDMYNNTWNIGVSVSYPLFTFWKNNHKIKESYLQVSLYKNAEQQEMQRIRMEVKTAFLRHGEALQQVSALELSERQAQENYRIMQNRYLNQLAILTDLLDANRVRLDVELQLITARTRVIYTYYQLLKVCGKL